MHTISFQNEQR